MTIETVVHCYMTSKDAEELAAKLRDKEQNTQLGGDLTAKTWVLDSLTSIKFVVDQERARKHGLMR